MDAALQGSPAMDEATLREEVIAEMDFTEAQVKKVQAMQMQETGRAFFFLVDIVHAWRYRSCLALPCGACRLVTSVVWS